MKRLSRPVYMPTNLNSILLRRLHDDDPTLVRIVFSSRNLGSQGVNVLAKALQNNTHLSALDLSHNSIGPEGAQFLATVLQHQTRSMIAGRGGIKTLILGDNNLRDDGVKALADALVRNSMVETLSIDDNCIGASGLALLVHALAMNTNLRRLHLKHNSFQSLSPLITCTFDRQSLESVADSNHSLRYVFLNCGYSYECEELEMILKINRLGELEARRKKIALYFEEDFARLLQIDVDRLGKLLPRLLSILAQHATVSTMFRAMQNFPSEILFYQGSNPMCDPMDAGDSMDVEYLSW